MIEQLEGGDSRRAARAWLDRAGIDADEWFAELDEAIGAASRRAAHESLRAACAAGGPVAALLAAGADPNAMEWPHGHEAREDEDNRTPLMLATVQGDTPAMTALLAAGANPNQRIPCDGTAALEYAVYTEIVDVVFLLLVHGADVNHLFSDGQPALSAAMSGETLAMLEFLLDPAFGADVDKPAWGGWTPLHEAADDANGGAIRLLLERGADPNAQTDEGETPMGLVSRVKAPGTLRAARDLAVAGGCVATPDKSGKTPMQHAVDTNQGDLKSFFSTVLALKLTPVQIAARWGVCDVSAVLSLRGPGLNRCIELSKAAAADSAVLLPPAVVLGWWDAAVHGWRMRTHSWFLPATQQHVLLVWCCMRRWNIPVEVREMVAGKLLMLEQACPRPID
ncbi:ankyrin repeat domain-containing protein [Nereida ignava]|uniref:ankyrin repeat domain-containing protein n=1 Tax=Nereida ignava TaxID=282199 RepID=UPI0030F6B41C